MIMAANGYIVIAPNRHGVPGFGAEWNRVRSSGDYGGQNMQDYYAATDYIGQSPTSDADHVGAIGALRILRGSWRFAGHNDGRYAALVAHAGIFNVEAQYLGLKRCGFADFDLGGPYWDEGECRAPAHDTQNSPHRYVNNWTAPMLITVGEPTTVFSPPRVRWRSTPRKCMDSEAEMVVFPTRTHWVIKPQNAILWQRCFFRFLDKYLKTDK